jgi:hypothetical protein
VSVPSAGPGIPAPADTPDAAAAPEDATDAEVPEVPEAEAFDPIPDVEAFIAATGAAIRIPSESAHYSPSTDTITMPDRELFFGSLSGLLAGTFPVLHAILGAERWARLVRDFYRDHRCHTPLFLEVPREFVEYLGNERPMQLEDPPFLQELAHYEWVELALGIDEQNLDAVRVDPDGDLLAGIPVLSPLAWQKPKRIMSPSLATMAVLAHRLFRPSSTRVHLGN